MDAADKQWQHRCQSYKHSFCAAVHEAVESRKHGKVQLHPPSIQCVTTFYTQIPTPMYKYACAAKSGSKRWGLTALLTEVSDMGHTALDVAGMVPVIGEAADIANAGWYAIEGDYMNAALSAAGAIPLCGSAVTACKLGGRIQGRADDVLDDLSEAAESVTTVRSRTEGDRPTIAIVAPAVAAGIVIGAVGARRYWFPVLRFAVRARQKLRSWRWTGIGKPRSHD